jgi:hypothetical protein
MDANQYCKWCGMIVHPVRMDVDEFGMSAWVCDSSTGGCGATGRELWRKDKPKDPVAPKKKSTMPWYADMHKRSARKK